MIFHTCHFFCNETEAFRRDWKDVDPLTQISYDHYRTQTLARQSNLLAVHETSQYQGSIQTYAPQGCVVANLHMTGIIGMGCLYLFGKLPGVEQKYCMRFQQRIAALGESRPVLFPLTPMEIESRPLFFYVFFTLDDNHLWKSSAQEMILWANGIGLALKDQLTTAKRGK